jgi:hypothetical protein
MFMNKIRAAISQLDLTQGEVARAIGASGPTMSMLLNNDKDHSKSDIYKGILLMKYLRQKGIDLNNMFD